MSDIDISAVITQIGAFVGVLVALTTFATGVAAFRQEPQMRTRFNWATEAWQREEDKEIKDGLGVARKRYLAFLLCADKYPLSAQLPRILMIGITAFALGNLSYELSKSSTPESVLMQVALVVLAFSLSGRNYLFIFHQRELHRNDQSSLQQKLNGPSPSDETADEMAKVADKRAARRMSIRTGVWAAWSAILPTVVGRELGGAPSLGILPSLAIAILAVFVLTEAIQDTLKLRDGSLFEE